MPGLLNTAEVAEDLDRQQASPLTPPSITRERSRWRIRSFAMGEIRTCEIIAHAIRHAGTRRDLALMHGVRRKYAVSLAFQKHVHRQRKLPEPCTF